MLKSFLEITTDSRLRIAIDYGKGNRNPQKFWTLDPIDGTKGFIRGQQYSISLAYIENGEIKVGILGCPNLNPDCSGDPEEVNAKILYLRSKVSALGVHLSTTHFLTATVLATRRSTRKTKAM